MSRRGQKGELVSDLLHSAGEARAQYLFTGGKIEIFDRRIYERALREIAINLRKIKKNFLIELVAVLYFLRLKVKNG